MLVKLVTVQLESNMIHTQKQILALGNLVEYLQHNNPYYAELLRNVPVNDNDRMLETFKNVYPTTRDRILSNYSECLDKNFLKLYENSQSAIDRVFDLSDVSENYDKRIHVGGKTYSVENTSGSSGHPFPIVKSMNEEMSEAMQLLSSRKKVCKEARIDNGFLLVHKVDDYLKTLELKGAVEKLDPVIDYLIEKKPVWIFSSAYIFSRILNRIKQTHRESEIRNLSIKFVETTSQSLLSEEKEDLSEIFNAKSVSNYGCREVWNIAYEEKCDGRLYVNDRTLFVELLDENGNVITEEGVCGNIVVTSLVHRTLPFIRYFVGDSASFYYDEDGRVFFKLVEGRSFEKIYGTDYSGPYVFRNVLRTVNFKLGIQDIVNIRIIQDAPDHMMVYLRKTLENDAAFEQAFVRIMHDCIKHEKTINVDFCYQYPFEEQKSLYKQKIFECHINCNERG